MTTDLQVFHLIPLLLLAVLTSWRLHSRRDVAADIKACKLVVLICCIRAVVGIVDGEWHSGNVVSVAFLTAVLWLEYRTDRRQRAEKGDEE